MAANSTQIDNHHLCVCYLLRTAFRHVLHRSFFIQHYAVYISELKSLNFTNKRLYSIFWPWTMAFDWTRASLTTRLAACVITTHPNARAYVQRGSQYTYIQNIKRRVQTWNNVSRGGGWGT